MIRYVKGVYSMNVNGGIVVEIQSGLGLEIFLPVNSPIYRYGEGETIKVYTSMIVKEDDIRPVSYTHLSQLPVDMGRGDSRAYTCFHEERPL